MLLTWHATSEFQNLGFNVYRRNQQPAAISHQMLRECSLDKS